SVRHSPRLTKRKGVAVRRAPPARARVMSSHGVIGGSRAEGSIAPAEREWVRGAWHCMPCWVVAPAGRCPLRGQCRDVRPAAQSLFFACPKKRNQKVAK